MTVRIDELADRYEMIEAEVGVEQVQEAPVYLNIDPRERRGWFEPRHRAYGPTVEVQTGRHYALAVGDGHMTPDCQALREVLMTARYQALLDRLCDGRDSITDWHTRDGFEARNELADLLRDECPEMPDSFHGLFAAGEYIDTCLPDLHCQISPATTDEDLYALAGKLEDEARGEGIIVAGMTDALEAIRHEKITREVAEGGESKTTPAPWTAWGTPGDGAEVVASTQNSRDGYMVGEFPEVPGRPGQAMRNALLASAAPDLLEALVYLLEQTVDMDIHYGVELTEGEREARENAFAAIAKATGK